MGLAVFDSNIVIDVLAGIDQALIEMAYFDGIAISAVAWVEIMSKPIAEASCGKIPYESVQAIKDLLAEFTIIHTSDAIMAEAARLRAASFINPPKIRLPDVLIQATANVTGRVLVTRNKRDFCGPNVRIPYELQNDHIFNIATPPIGP